MSKAPLTACSAVPNPSNPHYNRLDHEPFLVPHVLSELALPFTLDDLTTYAERRKYGLSTYSVDWKLDFNTLFDPCHLNTSFYAGGGGSNCRFSRLIKKRSKGITVVVMDACHSEGRYFVNEGLNADDQHNGYGPEVLVSKKKRKKTLTNQSD